ncbi:hypothetical protein [Synechococcus elongatus]|uniref:hypothetical protein n=1 Tax=Synechococcus elongatus TaxID=32046 RepID=UPI000F7DF256|nr:hypothetical protein [Synechococcus elongatus]
MNADQAFDYVVGNIERGNDRKVEAERQVCPDIEMFLKNLEAECNYVLGRAQAVDQVMNELPDHANERQQLREFSVKARDYAGSLMSVLASACLIKKLMEALD